MESISSLVDELKEGIQQIVKEQTIIRDDSPSGSKLCYTLEKILQHGLKGNNWLFHLLDKEI